MNLNVVFFEENKHLVHLFFYYNISLWQDSCSWCFLRRQIINFCCMRRKNDQTLLQKKTKKQSVFIQTLQSAVHTCHYKEAFILNYRLNSCNGCSMVLFISELSAKPGSAQYQWEPILLSRDRAAESTESNKSIWRSLYPCIQRWIYDIQLQINTN